MSILSPPLTNTNIDNLLVQSTHYSLLHSLDLKRGMNVNCVKLPVAAKVFCLISFLLHTAVNIKHTYLDEKLVMGEEYADLSSITFPLLFDISISPGIKQDSLTELGFANTIFYYYGKNKYMPGSHGWAGRYSNGTLARNMSGIL